MRLKGLLRNLGFVSTLLWAVPGTAETLRNGDVVGDWKFSCVASSQAETSCGLTQTILIEPGAPPLARITFERSADPEQLLVSLFVPVGSALSFSPLLAAGEQGLAFSYIVCTSEGCFARTLVTVESLSPFLVSDQLAVIYKRYGVEGMVRIPASSNGLLDAFKSLGLL